MQYGLLKGRLHSSMAGGSVGRRTADPHHEGNTVPPTLVKDDYGPREYPRGLRAPLLSPLAGRVATPWTTAASIESAPCI